ncbi:hypothetical protein KUCAC02_004398, partial [Chaenocephalus aceratus]
SECDLHTGRSGLSVMRLSATSGPADRTQVVSPQLRSGMHIPRMLIGACTLWLMPSLCSWDKRENDKALRSVRGNKDVLSCELRARNDI